MEDNNKVHLTGQIISEFTFSHEAYNEKFYRFEMSVLRLSGNTDVLQLLVSEKIVDTTKDLRGEHIEVLGQYRSYNVPVNENKTRLVLYVFVQELIEHNDNLYDLDENNIELNGYVCKQPRYRKTPLGREITDLIIGVNRPHRQSDYIPCIAWGRNAKYSMNFEVGQQVKISGRIQDREYQKKLSDETYETRTAYEVSITSIEKIEEENNEFSD